MRQQEDPDTKYVLDMERTGASPSKGKAVRRQTLQSVRQKPVIVNDVRGEDQHFDQCWEDTVHGRRTSQERDEGSQEPADHHH